MGMAGPSVALGGSRLPAACRFRSEWGRCPTPAWDRKRVCPRIRSDAAPGDPPARLTPGGRRGPLTLARTLPDRRPTRTHAHTSWTGHPGPAAAGARMGMAGPSVALGGSRLPAACRFWSEWGRCPTAAWDRNRVCPGIRGLMGQMSYGGLGSKSRVSGNPPVPIRSEWGRCPTAAWDRKRVCPGIRGSKRVCPGIRGCPRIRES